MTRARLGPGHLGGIVSMGTRDASRDAAFYRRRLLDVGPLSHLTVEVDRLA